MDSPSLIPNTSERVLEFDLFRQLLAGRTASPLGHERVMQLTPSRDRQWIELQQQLTEELRGYLRTGGRFDFHGLLDPAQLIDKARIAGAALDVLRDERSSGMKDHTLVVYARTHENLLITPHIGGCTLESMEQTEEFLAEKVVNFLQSHSEEACVAGERKDRS